MIRLREQRCILERVELVNKLRVFLLSLGFIVFLFFAYLQLNDLTQYGNSDAWFWILIYMTPSIMSLMLIFSRLPPALLYSWLGFTLGSLSFRLQDSHGNFHWDRLNPATFWNPRTTEMVQQSNECGGLLILLVWAGVLILLSRKKY